MHAPANRLLLAAAINADAALVSELLQAGADPNAHDSNKLTALHHAGFSTSKTGATKPKATRPPVAPA